MKVWDGFIRFFHWSMVLLVAGLYFSAEFGQMELHMLLGYTLMALVLTRLVWGVIGSDTAKLKALLHHPKVAIQALRANHELKPGHNPAGSYMVLLFLTQLTLQLLTGLMSTDDIMTDGPLVPYISSNWVSIATGIHEINFFVMLGFVVLHVLAIMIYRLKGKNLVGPMLTGKSDQHQGDAGQFKPVWQAFVIFLVLLGVLMLTWGQGPLLMMGINGG